MDILTSEIIKSYKYRLNYIEKESILKKRQEFMYLLRVFLLKEAESMDSLNRIIPKEDENKF